MAGPDQYENPVTYVRGGYNRNYTAKFTFVDDRKTVNDFLSNLDSSSPPFKNILAVGDGLGGSTCDTFSKSAWFFSKANADQPKFKYATFGGTGKIEDSASSSFPGGNVYTADLLTQAWAYAAVAYLQAEWAGDTKLAELVLNYVEYLPLFPGFLDNKTPRYSQSEIYRKAMGPNSLPMEFYLIPPDHQIKAWYRGTSYETGGDLPADSALLALYSRADELLKNM